MEKIGDTSNFSLTSVYNGIYTTAPATRFTVFAVKSFVETILTVGCLRNSNCRVHYSNSVRQIPSQRMALLVCLYSLIHSASNIQWYSIFSTGFLCSSRMTLVSRFLIIGGPPLPPLSIPLSTHFSFAAI